MIHNERQLFDCKICGTSLKSKSILRKHVALHKKRLSCNFCNKEFNSVEKLESHVLSHSNVDRPFKCDKCPSTFTTYRYLGQHKLRVHIREGFFSCKECDATFKRMEIFRSHMEVHKGVTPYKCDECGARYNQKITLMKHQYEHRQREKKKEASQSDSKISVNKTSHKNGNDKCEIQDSFKCETCSQSFFKKRQLNAHRKQCNQNNKFDEKSKLVSNSKDLNNSPSKAVDLISNSKSIVNKSDNVLKVRNSDTKEIQKFQDFNFKLTEKNIMKSEVLNNTKDKEDLSYSMPSSFKNYKQKSDKLWKKMNSNEFS